jgi:hypothetical protein
MSMKLVTDRPFADPKAAARKLLEIANATEAVQDGRIHIEKINRPFLFQEGGTPAECTAGLKLAIAQGWLWLHESGTYVKFTSAGAELFA